MTRQGPGVASAISTKTFSCISCSSSSDFWYARDCSDVMPTNETPPLMNCVAASGTMKTLMPWWLNWLCSVPSAVVLPAQGPPVSTTFHSLWGFSCGRLYRVSAQRVIVRIAVPVRRPEDMHRHNSPFGQDSTARGGGGSGVVWYAPRYRGVPPGLVPHGPLAKGLGTDGPLAATRAWLVSLGEGRGGSMVGIDRLNVRTVDTFSHWPGGSCTIACVPFLVGVFHYRLYIGMYSPRVKES